MDESMNNNEENPKGPMILLTIRSMLTSFNPALKKIARFFLNDYNKMDYMNISDIANKSGVSESSVTRFIREVGYKNFKLFQIELARSSNENNIQESVYGVINKGDSVQTICEKVIYSNIKGLEENISLLQSKMMQSAANSILEARNVLIYASGRSSVAAKSAMLRFYRLGINCFNYSDVHEQTISSVLVSKKDVVIGISDSGRSGSVVRSLRNAKGMGACTIAITSHKGSPLSEIAGIVLYTTSSHEVSMSNVEPSYESVVQVILLDCLYMIIYMKMQDKANKLFKITADIMESERI